MNRSEAISANSQQPLSNFVLVVNGMICNAELPGSSRLCCHYRFVYGNDWEVVTVTGENACLVSGVTQVAERARGVRPIRTWNFPLEIAFRSTNPYGWPKLVVTVSEVNSRGSFPIAGYGWCHVPVNPGRYSNVIRLFKPKSSSAIQSILSTLTGKQPEIINFRTICSSEGREVMRTRSEGVVKVTFDIVTKDMQEFGFEKTEKLNGMEMYADEPI
jgi:B9 domain-containing protein 1